MSVKAEIDALTGIRFFAAIMVLLFHMGDSYVVKFFPDMPVILGISIYEFLTFCGALGVDLFFVLSGFILAYNYDDKFQQFNAAVYRQFIGSLC